MSTNYAKKFKVIEKKFHGLDNFLTFYADLLQLHEEQKGITPVAMDSSPFSTDRMITGIIMAAKAKKNSIAVEMIIGEYHRQLQLHETIAKKILKMQKALLAECDEKETDDIRAFNFLKHKPFLLIAQDSVVVELEPLDFKLYDKYYPEFQELMAEQ